MSELRNSDFMLEVAKGNIPGHSSVLKFGQNPDVDTGTEDIWDGGGTYAFYPTAAIAVDIVSTSGSDTHDITVFGLDGTGALQQEVITLTGTTEAPLSNTYWRIFRMVNTNTSANVGTITCAAAGGGSGVGDNVVAAQMTISFEQTLMALYTVPLGKTAYVTEWGASADQGGAGATPALFDVVLFVRPNSAVATFGVFQVKSHHGLISSGTSHFQHRFMPYFKIEALSDIVIRGTSSVNDADMHADFDIILVDN